MVRVITGILVQCDPPTMMILDLIHQEKPFIIYRISNSDVLVKEGSEKWLDEEVTRRLELAERGGLATESATLRLKET